MLSLGATILTTFDSLISEGIKMVIPVSTKNKMIKLITASLMIRTIIYYSQRNTLMVIK